MSFSKYLSWAGIALCGAVLLPSPSTAAIMTFDDRSAFEAAVAGSMLFSDAFDTPIPGAEQITLDSGIVSTNSPPSLQGGDNAVVLTGRYNNSVANSGTPSEFITWEFPTQVIGFGFDLFGAATDRLQVTFDGGSGLESFIFTDINVDVTDLADGGFVGFLADTAFESIVFSNALNGTDTFRIDDLSFAEAGPSVAVPLPSTLPLTLLGIGGLLFATRRRGMGLKEGCQAGNRCFDHQRRHA